MSLGIGVKWDRKGNKWTIYWTEIVTGDPFIVIQQMYGTPTTFKRLTAYMLLLKC